MGDIIKIQTGLIDLRSDIIQGLILRNIDDIGWGYRIESLPSIKKFLVKITIPFECHPDVVFSDSGESLSDVLQSVYSKAMKYNKTIEQKGAGNDSSN